jgi:pimeloyl-ACP methyl ester carboxylesterase
MRWTSPVTAAARAASGSALVRLDDYADDLAQVAQKLAEPAILIGHSMGSVVVERFLERQRRGQQS